ncbi:hypothetical protein [Actinoplanes friuliensis]|uniref:Capsular polysaccharide biosynthesis protein n=1 Tax=Actinoplanes friuliensis DSM 7358 TaxID=1246995 RepID=U5W0G8_9ACTN|nr:hypothetical protein [Actinoplanes friuliensis]AGZ41480.1 hypothetical protein AFR_15990 [Actinoplanes friuliensis DSM 7358]
MDLWDLTRLLLRRWYFAVPMLLLSVVLVIVAAQTVSPDYKANGYMQLIPAPSTGKPLDPKAKPRPANPWLDLGYAALGNAAALTVTDQANLDKLADEGFSDSVTVVLNERTPLFEIEAVGDSRQQATSTVQRIIKLLQDDIAAKQKQYGTLTEDTISTLVINDGSAPEQDGGKVKRVLIVAAGLGVLLTTASTIALDYWLRRRSRRRPEDDDDDAGQGSATSDPVPVGKAQTSDASRAGLLESAEKTRVLRPTRQTPPTNGNGNGKVYSGERRAAEAGARDVNRPANGVRESAAAAEPEPPVDATIVLPVPHQVRRGQENRS